MRRSAASASGKDPRVNKSVLIDWFPECAARELEAYDAVVAIDVIRATTTAITAVAAGRRCFPVPSVDAAVELAAQLRQPLLVGELGGNMPFGFDLTNSPAQIAERKDVWRPIVLLSSSGTRLLERLRRHPGAYAACFRNYRATAEHLARAGRRVAVLGAGTRGQFREEDQMCCAWIAERLLRCGFQPEDENTRRLAARWSGRPSTAFFKSKSVEYLRSSGQLQDLRFILAHFNDLDAVCRLTSEGMVMLEAAEEKAAA